MTQFFKIKLPIPWSMSAVIKRYAADTTGATAIEYGLIAALIGTVAVSAASALGGGLSEKFAEISSAFDEPAETVDEAPEDHPSKYLDYVD